MSKTIYKCQNKFYSNNELKRKVLEMKSKKCIKAISVDIQIGQCTLQRIIDGEGITIEVAKRVADFFGMEIKELFGDSVEW